MRAQRPRRLSLWTRLGDIAISTIALAVLSPLFLIIAILIKLDSPGPVIFRQRRYGLDGQIIDVFKFRTMNLDADARKQLYLELLAEPWRPMMDVMAGSPFGGEAGDELSGARAAV